MKFITYELSGTYYQKCVGKILMAFIQNPKLIKDLEGKLIRLAKPQDDGLSGHLHNLTSLTFIEVIQYFLSKGDNILKEVEARPRVGKIRDLYKAWEEAFYELEREVEGLEKNFADLVLALWILKQKLGKKSFSIFWEGLLHSYPEIFKFFAGPGASIISEPIKISKTRVPIKRKKIKAKVTVEAKS